MEPCEDPNHPMNSAKHHTGRKCIDCGNPAGTGWSPYWCQPCNAARLMRIDRSLKGMLAEMPARATTTTKQEGQAMTDKVTIERETLERVLDALLSCTPGDYSTGHVIYPSFDDKNVDTAITVLQAALAAQTGVDDHLKCGHHRSLAINSAETGEFLYCDLCDAKSRCRDAEAMEAELRAALAAQPAEPVALDNACMTEQAIDEYLSDYTMEGDSGSHTPDESELLVIKDAIMGLLVYPDFLASFAQSDPAAVPLTGEMDKVASRYAHKMALDLECILAEYGGSWYNTAMQTLGEYRSAMNAIHERESPTFMGEPVIAAAAGDKP